MSAARMRWLASGLLACVLGAGCVGPQISHEPSPDERAVVAEAPAAPREFRAAWVATVANIDWPSKPGLPARQMREEMRAILDRSQRLGLNALILQVRPAADAIYPSKLEPWTEYLSGRQGKSPGWFYDPLREWITEAHRRGLELHVWLNPYRARHQTAKSPLAKTHLANTHPDAVKSYGELLWMDPGNAVARQRTLDVVADLVSRYDVDGVHIDDYFYPYPLATPANAVPDLAATLPGTIEFPDDTSWKPYLASGGTLKRADWRRENVNELVHALHTTLHRVKPWVRFGVSPFGIGRPDRRPPGILGFSQYDQLYADVEHWVEQGWMDYLSPQLYWPIEQKAQGFAVLLDYWIRQNTRQRHLWPGLYTSMVADTPRGWPSEQIVRQVELLRSRPQAGGHIHFSTVALMQDRRGVASKLEQQTYATPALVPATPWLATARPAAPRVVERRLTGSPDRWRIRLAEVDSATPTAPVHVAIWRKHGDHWQFSVQAAGKREISLAPDPVHGPVSAVVVSAIDRLGQESERVGVVIRPVRPTGVP
ncbi:MAG: family 10 glycosylhydrolase [Opitutaceae bacterium]